MGVFNDYCSDWTILGNNFNNLYTYFVPIWLGPESYSCTIVGGDNIFNVFDEGTDNILAGINNQGNPPGPEISDIMKSRTDRKNRLGIGDDLKNLFLQK